MKHDLERLEARLREFDHKVRRLENLPDQLIPVIHGPGWTTIAEYDLVMLAVDALEQHVDNISRIQAQLVRAAQRVDDGPVSTRPGHTQNPGTDGPL